MASKTSLTSVSADLNKLKGKVADNAIAIAELQEKLAGALLELNALKEKCDAG